MSKHAEHCRESARQRIAAGSTDPTPEQIWGPINPETGQHMGGGLAEIERANRVERPERVRQVGVMMLPYGRGKLLGSE